MSDTTIQMVILYSDNCPLLKAEVISIYRSSYFFPTHIFYASTKKKFILRGQMRLFPSCLRILSRYPDVCTY